MTNIVPERAEFKGRPGVNLEDFLPMKLPPKKCLIAPWLPSPGAVMLYSYRGVGKTWISLGTGLAVASGASFLGWQTPEPAPVLYVDGEMAANDMQERLGSMVGAMAPGPRSIALQNFRLLSHELHNTETGIPNLADAAGRELVEEAAEGYSLIILDNLSTLYRAGYGENEAESWEQMQTWILMLRRKGKSVFVVHHGGKPDEKGQVTQRGTSKREDIMNTSISLTRPPGMAKNRFNLDFAKTRGFVPEDDHFTVEISEGGLKRAGIDEGEQAKNELIRDMIEGGSSDRAIKKELQVGSSRIARIRDEVRTAKRMAA
jgi:RecA-family ATPase